MDGLIESINKWAEAYALCIRYEIQLMEENKEGFEGEKTPESEIEEYVKQKEELLNNLVKILAMDSLMTLVDCNEEHMTNLLEEVEKVVPLVQLDKEYLIESIKIACKRYVELSEEESAEDDNADE